ncbi:hypothetical protein CC86DRAFT_406762 [Ophiobolus disseminans]|uniref:Zn(2)-C6 fungal-type domain-containing protein n=1 Tax=Ophiobolus disseminans TaxID=1469910 RepID=A0A6A6ZZK0_9PLEO|nr:hypothetical protein CC86DRAFT_406762 [Ophiobolus disseminans]
MSSTSSPFSKRGDRPSKSNTLSNLNSPRDLAPELSDVQCYTCRKRHVKCDRILPHCAKCAKKGVTCLGYRKPLRWADGVAVRGKLKGKTQPVIDSQALSVSQSVFEERRTTLREEVAHFGFHSLDNRFSNTASTDATFLELIHYHNTVMAAGSSEIGQVPVTIRKIALISPQVAKALPRDFLNCVLGTAAVHMAERNPGNRQIQNLALEAKVFLFEGINAAFQQPQRQRADVLFACTTLMFAMDIIEHGVGRWSTHFLGALKILASSAGLEHFASYYPHLRLQLATTSQFETMHVILSPMSIEGPRQASRNGLKTICFDPGVRKSFFVASPLPLMRAVYDMAVCARNIFQGHGVPSAADIYTREWILSDILRYRPDEGAQDIQNTYYSETQMGPIELQTWKCVVSAWRSSMAIVVLRYLFFGLPYPEVSFHISRSPTPTSASQEAAQFTTFDMPDTMSQTMDETMSEYNIEENLENYLSPEGHTSDPFSRSPSPMPSPRPIEASISFDYWHRRYNIHNEATAELFQSLSAISDCEDTSYLRYAALPLMVLALISQPGSVERNLCMVLLERFKAFMADQSVTSNPIGGSALDFDIPWERLDAYSAEMERQRSEPQLHSAPEWNWWFMLKHMNLQSVWPVIAGTMHMELGAEFWAFSKF